MQFVRGGCEANVLGDFLKGSRVKSMSRFCMLTWPSGKALGVQNKETLTSNLSFSTELSHWDFSHGIGLFSSGKASCNIVELPKVRCMLDVLVFP